MYYYSTEDRYNIKNIEFKPQGEMLANKLQ